MNGRGRRNVLERVRRLLPLVLVLAPAGPAAADGEVRLLTDDAIPRYLSRGQELAKAEQWDKVVDVLHRVVIGDPDVFPDMKEEVLASAVYSEDGRTFYPARELCLLELARLPPDGLRAYRDVHDAKARQLMADADATEEVEERLVAYAKVHDSYLPSSVGDDALERTLDLNIALGRFYEALAAGRRLVDVYPKDTDRDVALVLAKSAYCAARIGDDEQLTNLLSRLVSEYAGATVQVEGKAVPVEEIKDHPLFRRRDGAERDGTDWPVAGGNAARSRTAPDLPEDLPKKPFWSFSLAERDTRLTVCKDVAPGDVWMVMRHDRGPSPEPQVATQAREQVVPYPTISPVIYDGLLLYKDGRQIVARRVGSGTFVPLALELSPSPPTLDDPTHLSPLEHIRPGTQEAVKDSRVLEAIYEFLDYGAARLVAADGMIIATDCAGAPNELRGETPAVMNQPNMITVTSFDTGRLVWAWRGDFPSMAVRATAYDAWQRDYQIHRGAAFLGPGIASGGTIYTIAAEREGDGPGLVALWAMDAATGRVRFRTTLHYEDEITRQLPRGAAIAMAGGTVYAVTQAGVVAAVDALPPGRVKWITRYKRGFEGAQGGRRGFRGAKVKQNFAFNDPIVAEGKVLVAPADGDELIALDAESGRVAWAIPKLPSLRAASYVLGAKDGLLFLGGDKVFAINIRKGEIAWSKPLRAFRYGRGFVGERYVHVPTQYQNSLQSEVERFDLRTGTPAEPLVFDVKELGNLVSSDGRLIAANGREIMCFTTYEAEVARVDAALGRPRADRAALLLERGLLALAGTTKRRDQAREDFAKAVEATTSDATQLARRYAIENLFAIARERNDLGALDEAEKLVAPLRGERPHPYDAQVALLRAEALGRLSKGQEALAALEQFVDRYGGVRVVRDGRAVDGGAAGAALRDQLRSENEAFATAFAETVRGRIEAAVQRKDADGLKATLDRYGDEPTAQDARFALADLYEEAGRDADAEAELKDFVTRHPDHPRAPLAYLRIARSYVRQGKADAARRQLFEAVSRLDEAGRREQAALIAEVEAKLGGPGGGPPAPHLRFPLAAAPTAIEGTPVAVEGGLPEGLVIFATAAEYTAVDPAGKVRWSVRNPSRTGISPGPASEPATAAVAGEIAAARLAVRQGDDVLIGDVAGLMRINATSGEVLWCYQSKDTMAREEGQAAVDLLRRDLRDASAKGFALRAHPLPEYILVGNVVVRVHPRAGVDGIHARTGDLVWVDGETQGQVAVGPPTALGDFVVVGFSKPGWVRVYQATDGTKVATWRRGNNAALLAAPLVDRLGRIFVATSTATEGEVGQLEVLDIRGGESRRRFPLATGYAAPLHADGRVLVYHDGSSGTENVHFVDLDSGKEEVRRGPGLLRSFHVARDGSRIFVLTSNPGLEDEGGRLFRIDARAADVLTYDYAVRAGAFTRPLLTEHHVAVAAVLSRGAHVRLFDRDASPSSCGAQPLFLDPTGKETADLDFRAGDTTRFDTGIGIAAAGDGLVVGQPWGAARLAPPAQGGG
ncbi:MAG TPA: PQQ-binding-like beta-propeller repeat protein [Planctomycetota bacterium]|nr:PQQ-binding-like beta-propeller repeat protein [Planctomycetota bacterium]